MNIPTYDNAQFHLFLFVFFVIGALLNIGLGYFGGKPEYYLNGALLAILSICTYKLFCIYSDPSKLSKQKVYK